MASWPARYRNNLVSIDDALQVIQPGQTVAFGMNGNIPAGLCHALGTRLPSLPGLHLIGSGALEPFAFHQPDAAAQYSVQDMFLTAATRPAMQQRRIDFLPFTTALWPSDILDGSRPVDVYLTSVSPPDEHGYCALASCCGPLPTWPRRQQWLSPKWMKIISSPTATATSDLTGQVTAESSGPQMYSGIGGQLDFMIGAQLAKNGRSVTVLPSTAKPGTISRIVPQHPEGAIVSVPRTYLNYVVTEYGAVDLLGKSQRERAELLISIAHPDFRDELQQAAKALFRP